MPVPGHDSSQRPTTDPAEPVPACPDPGDARRPDPPPGVPTRTRAPRLLAAAAVVVLAVGAAAVTETLAHPDRLGVAFSGGGPRPAPSGPAVASGAGAVAAAAAEASTTPLAGRRRATFELTDGLTEFSLRVADLGEDLYRINAAADGGPRPRPEVLGDRVRLALEPGGQAGPDAVEVLLNSRVTWRLRLVGGVHDALIDLGAARAVAGVELIGGAHRIDLRLPPIAGALTVRMTGGVNQFAVRLADPTPPVRVRVAAGAGSVALPGARRDGVAAGEVISSPGWDRSVHRLYVDLVAGVHTVTVGAG
ncbi:hypothetical protein AB0H57_26570 [Micromonospora sp. NPDC050686]|uniref:hypothetical protein n=1 Tax=Micromonospora sp. NPDC050686 TaxID=3154631 RepID=UPI0033F8AE2D